MPQAANDLLREFYAAEGNERVGFVLDDGSVVEVENEAPEPATSFDICTEDLITFGDRAGATFHTHPGSSSNLSVEDHIAFTSWPDLIHNIVGSDGLSSYKIDGGKVVRIYGPA